LIIIFISLREVNKKGPIIIGPFFVMQQRV
jgi:hypothetical protein